MRSPRAGGREPPPPSNRFTFRFKLARVVAWTQMACCRRLPVGGRPPTAMPERRYFMRTVSGPTDRVVIVGAGLGGLACALRLAAAGRQVTVLERADSPGGRMGQLAVDGYRFDTGPTVLTMPDLL